MAGLKLHWADEPRVDRREASPAHARPSSSSSTASSSSSSVTAAEQHGPPQRIGPSAWPRRTSESTILPGLSLGQNKPRPGDELRRSISASTSPSATSLWAWSASGTQPMTGGNPVIPTGGPRRPSTHDLDSLQGLYPGGEGRRPSLSAGVGLLSAKMREHQGTPQPRVSSCGILKKDQIGQGDGCCQSTAAAPALTCHARFQEPPKPERVTTPSQPHPKSTQSRALSDGELDGTGQGRRRITHAPQPRRPVVLFREDQEQRAPPRRGMSSSPPRHMGSQRERAATEGGTHVLGALPQPLPLGAAPSGDAQPRKRSIAFDDERIIGAQVAQHRAAAQEARGAGDSSRLETPEPAEPRQQPSTATPLRPRDSPAPGAATDSPHAPVPGSTTIIVNAAGTGSRRLTFAASPQEVTQRHVERASTTTAAATKQGGSSQAAPDTALSAASSSAAAPAMEVSAILVSDQSDVETSQPSHRAFLAPTGGFEARPSTPPPSPNEVRMTGPGGGAPRPGHIVLLSAPCDRSSLRARRTAARSSTIKATASPAIGHGFVESRAKGPKRMCGSPAPEKLTFREKVGGIRGGLGGSPAPRAGAWPDLGSDEEDDEDVDDDDEGPSDDEGYDDDNEGSSDDEGQGQDSDWDEDSEEDSDGEHKSAALAQRRSPRMAPAWRREAGLHLARTNPGADPSAESLSSMLPDTFYDDNAAEEEMLVLGPPRAISTGPEDSDSAAGTSLPLLSQSSARSRSFGPSRSAGRGAYIGPARPGPAGGSSSRSSSCNNVLRGYLSSPARTPSASRSPSVSAGAGPGAYGLVSPRPTRPGLGGHQVGARSTSTAGSSRSPLSSPVLTSPSLWCGASPSTSYGTSRRSFSAAAGVRTPSASGTPGTAKCAPSIDTQHTAASLLLSPRSNDDDGEHDALSRLRDQLEAISSPSARAGEPRARSTSRSTSPAPHSVFAHAPNSDPSAPSSPHGLASPLLSQAAHKLLGLQRGEACLQDGEAEAHETAPATATATASGGPPPPSFHYRPSLVGGAMRHSSSPDHLGLAARREATQRLASPPPLSSQGVHAERTQQPHLHGPLLKFVAPGPAPLAAPSPSASSQRRPIRIERATRDASLSADDINLPGVAAARRKELARRRPYASEMGGP